MFTRFTIIIMDINIILYNIITYSKLTKCIKYTSTETIKINNIHALIIYFNWPFTQFEL